MSRSIPPTGQQVELVLGAQRAVVVEVGAGLRQYAVSGTPVVDGYAESESCSGGRGQVLIPWPNRLYGGTWSWEGKDQHLPLDENPPGNALHGLTRWVSWRLVEQSASAATWSYVLHPQPGWPGTLACRVAYRLTAALGLAVEISATNVGTRSCPAALGAHPYVHLGGAAADETWVHLLADEVITPSGPGTTAPVADAHVDLRRGDQIGPRRLDHSFTALRRGADRHGSVQVRTAAAAVEIWFGDSCRWVHLYTADNDQDPARRRRSLAVEPMTAPPGALQTGWDLDVLQPGQSLSLRWGVRSQLLDQR